MFKKFAIGGSIVHMICELSCELNVSVNVVFIFYISVKKNVAIC